MKPANYQRLRDAFLAALKREGVEREAWLLENCGDDEEMLAKLRRLLASEQEASQFLEPTDPTSDSHETDQKVSERIGPVAPAAVTARAERAEKIIIYIYIYIYIYI